MEIRDEGVIVSRIDQPHAQSALQQVPEGPSQVGMPRRFSIGTIMILTGGFALVFAGLKALNVHPAVFIIISIFIAGVAASQALLFKGRNPRLASIVAGSFLFGLPIVIVSFVSLVYSHGSPASLLVFIPTILMGLGSGAFLGYLVGTLIAGIFLFRKEPEDILIAALVPDPEPSPVSEHERVSEPISKPAP